MNICERQTDNRAAAQSTGRVHSFETLGALDGPGIRTVVFLSGCPMRCAYCHNPDTWQADGGTQMTAQEVYQRIARYRPYFKENGGVTLSGGEPLMQADFAAEIFLLCRADGIHTALDTSGALCTDGVERLLTLTDLVILDVKHTDPGAFYKLTGYPMEHLLSFIQLCKEMQKRLWLRQVIVPGVTDGEKNIRALRQLAQQCGAEKTELLPYHTHGVHKWEKLGLTYPLANAALPDEQLMENLNRILTAE